MRTLVDAGFLEPAGEGRKRNLIEKRYRASAHSYLLLPGILGEMSPGAATDADRFSAAYLMLLSARMQEELAAWVGPTSGAGEDAAAGVGEGAGRRHGPGPWERVPTLSMEADLRFESAAQRGGFAGALREAVTGVIERHTAPARDHQGRPRSGRAYRLVVGCYPLRDSDGDRTESIPTASEERRG